jgi:hypothetical protein
MSGGPIRRLAGLVGGLLERVYPKNQADWAKAMRFEIEQVEDDGRALRFALGCLWSGFRQAAAERPSATTKGDEMTSQGFSKLGRPRTAGIACASAATGLGLCYLAAAGAPMRYLVVNAAALLLGITAFRGLAGAAALHAGRLSGPFILALGACLLATALFGASADGAARWIWIGPLSVQVSLVLLPPIAIAFARRPDPVGAAGIAVAAAALALQPDRAMAGTLALAMAVLALARPGRFTAAASVAAATAFAGSLLRPDSLPAVPFVDGILFTAFEIHPLAGAAVLLGALLLLVPPLLGLRRDPADRAAHFAFAALWLGCLLAAALGNYPTPVVGYGGSAILGYFLGLSFLPPEAGAAAAVAAGGAEADDPKRPAAVPRSALPA